mgnify:CR=1 FL=1
MTPRRLGNQGLVVSRQGLGCMGMSEFYGPRDDAQSIELIESMLVAGKPVAAVCHAPAVLRHVKTAKGVPVVKGRAVTGFANSEERAAGLAEVVPFLIEDMLAAQGGRYSKAADWQPHVVADRELITGQNPASSAPAALALLERLRERAA